MPRKPKNRLRSVTLAFLASAILTFTVAELLMRICFRTDHMEFVADEELLWKNRPNQVIRLQSEPGQGPRVTTVDERGFRRTIPPVPPGARRLLVMGDSAMFANNLDDGETFSSQLQLLVGEKLEVINTGVPGWGLFQEEIFLPQAIETLRPDIVLVHHQSLDVNRQPFPADQPNRKTQFLWESRLNNAVRHYSKLATMVIHLARWVILNRTGRGVVNEVVDSDAGKTTGPTDTFRQCWKSDHDRFVAMNALVEKHGARFVILTGGPRDNIPPSRSDPNIDFFLHEMAALCRSNNLLEVDLTGRFRSYDDINSLTMLPFDGHPSALWNRLAAEETYRTLSEAGLLGESPALTQVP